MKKTMSLFIAGFFAAQMSLAAGYKPYQNYKSYASSPEGVDCKALLKKNPVASDCAGTPWFCRAHPADVSCQGTPVYCLNQPSDNANCAGTEARCIHDMSKKIANSDCTNTKVFCEVNSEASFCQQVSSDAE